MDENILLSVISVYESITIPYIKPLDYSGNFLRNYFSVSQPIFDVSGVTLRLLIFNLGCCHFDVTRALKDVQRCYTITLSSSFSDTNPVS